MDAMYIDETLGTPKVKLDPDGYFLLKEDLFQLTLLDFIIQLLTG